LIRERLVRLLGGVMPAETPAAMPAPLPDEHSLDLDGVKAFGEQARWAHGYHDKRSEVFGQRAATILAFDGALLSVLVAGLVAVRTNVDFTDEVVVNVALLAACPVISAFCCLLAMSPRKVTIPDNKQLRDQWARFVKPGSKLRPPAQIVHALLGGSQDPLASAAAEATSRGRWYERALIWLILAVLALGALAVQLLFQQA
jgi:hypothetical protein